MYNITKNLYLKEFTDYFNEQVSYHVWKKVGIMMISK